jgi:glycosyltransferase involved in cell wall biosynthesis
MIALSKWDEKILRWLGAQARIKHIPPPVNPPTTKRNTGDRIRQKLGVNNLFLSVGVLSPLKNQHITLEAFADYAVEHPSSLLLMAGRDGGTARLLMKEAQTLGIAEKVMFLGYIPEQLLHRLYSCADVFIHTSNFEGLSIVLLEAMAVGLSVVTTPAGGNGYLVKESQGGLVVPFDQPKAVRDALTKLMSDPSLRRKLGSNGEEYVRKFCDPELVIEKTLSFYQEVLAS